MKIVLDTNVFISAFFWGGNPRKVLQRAIEGLDELYVCKEILDEIGRVLQRHRFGAEPVMIDYFIKAIEDISKPVWLTPPFPQLWRDPADNKILACALAGQVDCIITNDNDANCDNDIDHM